MWDLLSGLNERGRTVVLTTHYMDEAETLCDRVAIMNAGWILQVGSPAALVRGLDAPTRITVASGQVDLALARDVVGVEDAQESDDGLVLTTRAPGSVLAHLAEHDLLDGVRATPASPSRCRGTRWSRTTPRPTRSRPRSPRARCRRSSTAPTWRCPARHRGTPLETDRVEDDSLTTIQFVTPGLLGWAVAMSAAFGAAATLHGWRQSKLMRRLQLSPVSARTLVGARVLVTVAIALVQLAIFVGLGAAAFGLTLTGSWWAAIPLLVVGTLCFMALGLLAGAIATTTEGAVNAANFMVLPMAFLSGSFFPLDAAPGWVRAVSNLLPLKHLNEGMLDVMVRGEGPGAVLAPAAILAAFAAVVTLVAARLFRWKTA